MFRRFALAVERLETLWNDFMPYVSMWTSSDSNYFGAFTPFTLRSFRFSFHLVTLRVVFVNVNVVTQLFSPHSRARACCLHEHEKCSHAWTHRFCQWNKFTCTSVRTFINRTLQQFGELCFFRCLRCDALSESKQRTNRWSSQSKSRLNLVIVTMFLKMPNKERVSNYRLLKRTKWTKHLTISLESTEPSELSTDLFHCLLSVKANHVFRQSEETKKKKKSHTKLFSWFFSNVSPSFRSFSLSLSSLSTRSSRA